jgi:hypothetical protein
LTLETPFNVNCERKQHVPQSEKENVQEGEATKDDVARSHTHEAVMRELEDDGDAAQLLYCLIATASGTAVTARHRLPLR